ncbi:MAG: hypothetical protein LQ352_005853 [Teloschistes flavicans]|nr:MAG: hypothetical protein LQ352_005853 [Teloschistes flavicans]
MEESERTSIDPKRRADHLCVLVHGFWGNPTHLEYLAKSLRGKHPEDKLNILVAKSNSGSYTYDGIETGGERVTQEVETLLQELERDGSPVAKLSVVGYSLGGLIARYAIGLLYSKGYFDRIQPVNFTTFATPHLGIRTPLWGYHNYLWNALGSRTLSTSGRQLFTIDTFRDTKRPILSVLADPDSIFIRALSLFSNRALYANIINDRSVPYYTAAIAATDPFVDLDAVDIRYLDKYSPILLNIENPVSPKSTQEVLPLSTRLATSSQNFLTRVPLYTAIAALIPLATVVWTINSGVQSFRSNQRIQLHEQGEGLNSYRIPLLMGGNTARSTLSGAFRRVNSAHGHDYLPESDGEEEEEESKAPPAKSAAAASSAEEDAATMPTLELKRTTSRKADFPTLALSDEQFAMIRNLDRVGWRKYLVHIRNHRHTHAAIIVRMQKPTFEEGKVVVRHWLDEEFEI